MAGESDPDDGNDGALEVLLDERLTDDVFQALLDRERRFAMYFLLEHETVALDELVDVVTGWPARDGEVATRADREAVAVAFRHEHLPVLTAADLVERPDEETVVLSGLPGAVRDLLRWLRDHE